MNLLLALMLCYCLLWLAVWLHEVGHGLFYRLYGCKGNPLRVTVPPSLFLSSPAPVDREKADQLPPRRVALIWYGGVLADLLWAAVCVLVLRFAVITSFWVLLGVWLFLCFHMAEAVSCLLPGSIFLHGDMAYVARACAPLRWISLLAGMALAFLWGVLLIASPAGIRFFLLLISAVVFVGRTGMRIVLASRANSSYQRPF